MKMSKTTRREHLKTGLLGLAATAMLSVFYGCGNLEDEANKMSHSSAGLKQETSRLDAKTKSRLEDRLMNDNYFWLPKDKYGNESYIKVEKPVIYGADGKKTKDDDALNGISNDIYEQIVASLRNDYAMIKPAEAEEFNNSRERGYILMPEIIKMDASENSEILVTYKIVHNSSLIMKARDEAIKEQNPAVSGIIGKISADIKDMVENTPRSIYYLEQIRKKVFEKNQSNK
jgi:hypothetical protein